MYTVYVIYSKKLNKKYTGYTNNFERRISEHNSQKNRSTRFATDWDLIYSETFEFKIEAEKREKFLKSGKGREFLKIQIMER